MRALLIDDGDDPTLEKHLYSDIEVEKASETFKSEFFSKEALYRMPTGEVIPESRLDFSMEKYDRLKDEVAILNRKLEDIQIEISLKEGKMYLYAMTHKAKVRGIKLDEQ